MQAFLIFLIALIVLGGGYFWYSQQPETMEPADTGTSGLVPPSNEDMDHSANTNPTTPGTSGNTSATPTIGVGNVKEFSFTSKGFVYTPSSFTVKKGDRVKVTYTNTGGTHDFRIDGYGVGTNVIQSGQTQTFEFVADKAGTFEFYCSVGNHRAMGMKGAFTVTE